MAYQAIPFGNFSGGLNLKDKADVVQDSQAIDLLNVEFTERGAVKQRDGFLQFTGTALTNRVDSLEVLHVRRYPTFVSGVRYSVRGD